MLQRSFALHQLGPKLALLLRRPVYKRRPALARLLALRRLALVQLMSLVCHGCLGVPNAGAARKGVLSAETPSTGPGQLMSNVFRGCHKLLGVRLVIGDRQRCAGSQNDDTLGLASGS